MSQPNLPAASRPFILVILALALGGCRASRRPDIKADPPIQTNTGSVSKGIAEKPLLEGRIETVSMYPVPNHREDLAISLVVFVRNSGSPSTAQDWNLEVNSPNRRVPTVLEPVHISGYVEMPGTNGAKVDLAKEDLVLKTAQVPIAKGAWVNGILTFVLAKTSESGVSNNNTSFTIHFKDSQGNSYLTPKSIVGGKATGPISNPGLKGAKP